MKRIEFEVPRMDMDGKSQAKDEKGNLLTDKHWAIIKRLNYGEKVGLEEEATNIQIVGNQPITKISTAKLRILSIMKSVAQSSIPLNTWDAVSKLPQDAGDLLFEAYIELNTPNPKSTA